MSIDYTRKIVIRASVEQAFEAICEVQKWWSEEIIGCSNEVGGVFVHQVRDIHRCEMEVLNLDYASLIRWRVNANYFNFTKDPSEWTGDIIEFRISADGESALIEFTHFGLSNQNECFDVCSDGWSTYLESLKRLIETGAGNPYRGDAITASERRLMT